MKSENNSFYYTLTKDDTNIIKAVGILFIVMHNYLHLTSFIGENELAFDRAITMRFIEALGQGFFEAVNAVFVYLGHYGVELFVFISAYGLTKKCLSSPKEPYFKYLFNRLIKIYSLLITGLIFFFVFKLTILSPQQYIDITLHFLKMTYTLKLSTIFLYVGPWWFFSLIVQLYILFPFLFYIIQRFGKKGAVFLLTVSYIFILALFLLKSQKIYPVFGNAPGHLPEFILGISLAFFPKIKMNYKVVIPAAVLFVGGCFFKPLFPFTFLTVTIVSLAILKPLLQLPKKNLIIKALVWIGGISMFIFLINGIIRSRTLKWIYWYTDPQAFHLLVSALLHLVLVIVVSYIIYLIYKQVDRVMKKYTGIRIL